MRAIPTRCWEFIKWSGAASGRNPNTQAMMNESCSIARAHFGQIDLEVKSKMIYISTPSQRNQKVWITTWVYNNGTAEAKNVKVKFVETMKGRRTYEETQVIPSIKPTSYKKVYIGRKIENVNLRKYTITADPDNEICEPDETNNVGETHVISGQVTDEDNRPLKHAKVELIARRSRRDTVIYTDFTDDKGNFFINTNLDVIRDGDLAKIRSRLEFSPDDSADNIRFKFYHDDDWDALRLEQTFHVDTATWTMDRARNYTDRNIQFTWRQGGRMYTTLVQAYEFFKNNSVTKFKPPAMDIEFMNDTLSECDGSTSCQIDDTIHMWYDSRIRHTQFRCVIAHEYAHRVSAGWRRGTTRLPYDPIDESWANYASSLARGTSRHDWCGVDIAVDSQTDHNDPWYWRIAGAFWDLSSDQVIKTLKHDVPQTVMEFYKAYVKKFSAEGKRIVCNVFRRHGHITIGWPGCPIPLTRASSMTSAEAAQFTDDYTHGVNDTDGDGYWDNLTVDVGINVTVPGDYEVLGFLQSPNGRSCFARNSAFYTAGTHTVPLVFEGTCIYQKGLSGTYTLVELDLYDVTETELDYRSSAYVLPQSYSYTEFQKPIVVPTGTYTESVTDDDGDGLYDALVVHMELEAAVAGDFEISGMLFESGGNHVAMAWTKTSLVTGTQTVTLTFPAMDLYAFPYEGSYTLRNLSIISSCPGCEVKHTLVYESVEGAVLYTTQSYRNTQFDHLDASVVGAVTDHGTDADGDGLYDYLTVNATVQITATGSVNYSVLAELRADGDLIASASQPVTTSGSHSVTFNIDGMAIRRSRQDGPYELTILFRDDSRPCVQGSSCLRGTPVMITTTAAYTHTQFQLPPEDYLVITYGDHGTDTDGDSLYDYLTVDLAVSTVRPMTYTIAGSLTDADGEWLAYAETTTALDVVTRTVPLNFRGWDIWRTMNPSERYTLTLDIDIFEGQHLLTLSDVYSTSLYAFTQFDPPPAAFADSYGDQGVDTNQDGLYDSLEITATLNVLEMGTYRVQATLAFTDGAEIADAVALSPLITGTQVVTLTFNGMAIRDQGGDGPYTLRDLEVYNNGGQLLDYRTLAYTTTTAYDVDLFQLGGIISGTITGRGEPVHHAYVLATGAGFGDDRSDEAGGYRIPLLYSGTYTVTVYPPPDSYLHGAERVVEVLPGQVTTADFVLEPKVLPLYLPIILRK